MDDLLNSLKAQLYDRATSPLFSSFLISWIVWNHRLLFTLVSDLKLPEKFAYIDEHLYPSASEFLGYGFIGPAASAAFLIFLYPIPARLVYEHVRKEQVRLKEIQHRIENDTPLTQEDARSLRTKMREASSSFDKEIEEREEQIRDLRAELDMLKAPAAETSSSTDEPQTTDFSRGVLTSDQANVLRFIANTDSIEEYSVRSKFINDGFSLVKYKHVLDELERMGLIERFSSDGVLLYQSTPAGNANATNVGVSIVS